MEETKNMKRLRFLAIAEGISYLSFAITVPLKRIYGIEEPNYFVGMAHGILFIIYLLFCVIVGREYQWNFKTLFLAGVASLLPFGTFVADAKIFKKQESNTRI